MLLSLSPQSCRDTSRSAFRRSLPCISSREELVLFGRERALRVTQPFYAEVTRSGESYPFLLKKIIILEKRYRALRKSLTPLQVEVETSSEELFISSE